MVRRVMEELYKLIIEEKIKYVDNVMNDLKEIYLSRSDNKKEENIKNELIKLINIKLNIIMNGREFMGSYIKEIIRGDKICKIMVDGKIDELYIETNSSYFRFCFNNNPSYLHLLHLHPNTIIFIIWYNI